MDNNKIHRLFLAFVVVIFTVSTIFVFGRFYIGSSAENNDPALLFAMIAAIFTGGHLVILILFLLRCHRMRKIAREYGLTYKFPKFYNSDERSLFYQLQGPTGDIMYFEGVVNGQPLVVSDRIYRSWGIGGGTTKQTQTLVSVGGKFVTNEPKNIWTRQRPFFVPKTLSINEVREILKNYKESGNPQEVRC